MTEYKRITKTVEQKKESRVKSVIVRLCVKDCVGTVRVTDVMLQSGAAATGWIGNVSEIPYTLEG